MLCICVLAATSANLYVFCSNETNSSGLTMYMECRAFPFSEYVGYNVHCYMDVDVIGG